jgi:NADPH:quinone reductase-like Zn-dependent oxidoreductase
LKAIRLYETLGNQRVVLEEVPRPQIGAGEVLVRVHATAVTPGEPGWYPTLHTQNGDPRSQAILSHEFSGVIEEIAPDVAALAEGEQLVYGRCGSGVLRDHSERNGTKTADDRPPANGGDTDFRADGVAGLVRSRKIRGRSKSPYPWRGGRGRQFCHSAGRLEGCFGHHHGFRVKR